MPNAIAFLALLSWPVVAGAIFAALPVGRALVASLLAAYLLLPPPPAVFDFPLLPPLSKESIPTIVAILYCLLRARAPIRWLPETTIGRVLVAVFVLSPFMTVLTNQDPVFYGEVSLPALRFREAVSICIQQALFVAPMLLARHFLAEEEDQRHILVALMVAGLAYSLPALVEVRLSPQLNAWIYGYYQHSFAQAIRFGGYRPLVFLYHGLWLAFLLLTTAFAALTLMRAERSRAMVYGGAGIYLLVVLFLCKSTGAILYAAALLPLVLILGRRWQLHAACAMAFLALAYPILKGADLVPVDTMLTLANDIDPDRAASLRFRFDNEDILLDRAYERPVFGWGSWGRNHLLDPVTGAIVTVTDGRWIIVIGVFGWLGFLAEFGLLTLPVFLMWWRGLRGDAAALSPYAGAIALLLAVNVVDLIPNATITPVTFLLAGALLGYAERYRAPAPARRAVFETVL